MIFLEDFIRHISLIVDALLVGMLVIAVYFGYRLHRQLSILKSGKKDLNVALNRFITENDRAKIAIAQMQHNLENSKKQIADLLKEGEPLKLELSALIKASDSSLKKLDRHHQQYQFQQSINASQAKMTPQPRTINKPNSVSHSLAATLEEKRRNMNEFPSGHTKKAPVKNHVASISRTHHQSNQSKGWEDVSDELSQHDSLLSSLKSMD